MRRLPVLSLLLFCIFAPDYFGQKQKFADESYYLVDSMDLSVLDPGDRRLLDSCLRMYHAAKNDTDKVNALRDICDGMVDQSWHKYQYFQLQLIQKKLKAYHRGHPEEAAMKLALGTALNGMGYAYSDLGKPPLALEYYKRSLNVQKEISRSADITVANAGKKGMADSYSNLGMVYENLGEISLAIESYLNAIKIEESLKDKKGMMITYNNIASIYKSKGEVPLALEYYHKSLRLAEEFSRSEQKDIAAAGKSGMAYAYNNIGMIHDNQRDHKTALDYFQKSLKLREEISDKRALAESYNNIGAMHRALGDTALALGFYHKSLNIYEQFSDKRGLAAANNNIGFIYHNRGNLDKAIEYYNKSLRASEETGNKPMMAYLLANIGNVYLMDGQRGTAALALAKKTGERGLKLSRELGFLEQIERNALLLSKVARKQERWKEALEMFELQIHMHDSITSRSSIKAAAQQQAKYEYEKKQALTDKEHEKEMALAAEEKKRQRIVIYSVSGGMLLMFGLAAVIFKSLQNNRRKNKIISAQKEEVENQKFEVEEAHRQLAEHHKEIQDSINYAKRIQSAILPSMNAMQKALKDGFVLYKPKDVVAGDFYWMEQHNGIIYFAAADCTGHGVPGAMVSVVCSNALSKALIEEKAKTTGELLDKTREIVIQHLAKSGEEVKDGMDISVCALDFDKMSVQWSGANNPLWIIREGAIKEYKADKQPIGKYEQAKSFTTHDIPLQKGDALYVFTDGYEDQFGGEKGKKYKASQLKEKLLSVQNEKMDRQISLMLEDFEKWRGELEQVDDVCMIGVKV